MTNNLHNTVRIMRAIQRKVGNGSGMACDAASVLSLGTVLSPPPAITVKLDDIPITYEKGEILINETLVEHKREKVALSDKDPGQHSVTEGELTTKLPILKAGDRIVAAQLGRQKVVIIAKVVTP